MFQYFFDLDFQQIHRKGNHIVTSVVMTYIQLWVIRSIFIYRSNEKFALFISHFFQYFTGSDFLFRVHTELSVNLYLPFFFIVIYQFFLPGNCLLCFSHNLVAQGIGIGAFQEIGLCHKRRLFKEFTEQDASSSDKVCRIGTQIDFQLPELVQDVLSKMKHAQEKD